MNRESTEREAVIAAFQRCVAAHMGAPEFMGLDAAIEEAHRLLGERADGWCHQEAEEAARAEGTP